MKSNGSIVRAARFSWRASASSLAWAIDLAVRIPANLLRIFVPGFIPLGLPGWPFFHVAFVAGRPSWTIGIADLRSLTVGSVIVDYNILVATSMYNAQAHNQGTRFSRVTHASRGLYNTNNVGAGITLGPTTLPPPPYREEAYYGTLSNR